MTRHVFSNAQLAHVWVQQAQDEGRNERAAKSAGVFEEPSADTSEARR